MTPQQETFRAFKEHDKQGRRDAALTLLRDALRRGQFDASGIDRAGRLIAAAVADGAGGSRSGSSCSARSRPPGSSPP